MSRGRTDESGGSGHVFTSYDIVYDSVDTGYNKAAPKFHYPERSKFHITEFMAFAGTVGFYFCRIGKLGIAEQYYDVLKQLEPDDPQTKRLGRALRACAILKKTRSWFFPGSGDRS
jgi:hypothetical protein